MKKLVKLVTIAENNENCIILKVKKNAFMDLISLGCFDGNETMIRVTKGRNHTLTVWHTNGKSVSYDWGESGYRIVSDELIKMLAMVVDCIEGDLGVVIEGEHIKDTLHKSIKDAPKSVTMTAYRWKNESRVCVHRNHEFFRHFDNETAFLNWLSEHGWTIKSNTKGVCKTGCLYTEYECVK